LYYLQCSMLQCSHPCPRRDSNPQPLQAIGRRPSPPTARPLGSAWYPYYLTL
jgi:hypothetical protein